MPSYKSARTAEDIHREIAAVIRELKDPRVSGRILTVVRVDMSSDLEFGKVYVSSLNGMEDAREAVQGLHSAAGFISREVCRSLQLRARPVLEFIADDSVERGAQIFRKLNELKEHE